MEIIHLMYFNRFDSFKNTGSSRLVNQLLTEMDGLEERKSVFLIGATNRPGQIITIIFSLNWICVFRYCRSSNNSTRPIRQGPIRRFPYTGRKE